MVTDHTDHIGGDAGGRAGEESDRYTRALGHSILKQSSHSVEGGGATDWICPGPERRGGGREQPRGVRRGGARGFFWLFGDTAGPGWEAYLPLRWSSPSLSPPFPHVHYPNPRMHDPHVKAITLTLTPTVDFYQK